MTTRQREFPFHLRAVTAEDEPSVLALLRTTLGEKQATRKTASYWRWKHHDNPFGASYSVCAEDHGSGDLAGLRTLMRWRFTDSSGGMHQAARAVDTATHPGYQRRGIFSALTRYAVSELKKAGVAFIFNTPNASSLPGYLKLGWKVVDRWPVYVRPVRPLRTTYRALLPDRSLVGSSPEACGLVDWRHFRGHRGAELAEVLAEHERGRWSVGYRTERSMRYLDWRYGSHPDVSYGIHELMDATGRLDGCLIARPTRGARGLSAMLVTEVFVREPSTRSVRRLLRSAFRSVRCNYWIAHFAKGTIEQQALLAALFMQAPGRGYTWTALPLNATSEDPARREAWDLTLAELEIF